MRRSTVGSKRNPTKWVRFSESASSQLASNRKLTVRPKLGFVFPPNLQMGSKRNLPSAINGFVFSPRPKMASNRKPASLSPNLRIRPGGVSVLTRRPISANSLDQTPNAARPEPRFVFPPNLLMGSKRNPTSAKLGFVFPPHPQMASNRSPATRPHPMPTLPPTSSIQQRYSNCLALELSDIASAWRAFLKIALFALPSAAAQLPEHRITNIFKPLASPAEYEKDIALFVFAITGVIFVGVAGLIAYTIWNFRAPKDEPQSEEPPQVYGSNQIEVAWTVVPILIVFVLIGVSARVIAAVENASPPPADLKVTVIGHQWWWEVFIPITAS